MFLRQFWRASFWPAQNNWQNYGSVYFDIYISWYLTEDPTLQGNRDRWRRRSIVKTGLYSVAGGDTLIVVLVIRFTTVPVCFNFCIFRILFWYPFLFSADGCSGYMLYKTVQFRRGQIFGWAWLGEREGEKVSVWRGECYCVWMRERRIMWLKGMLCTIPVPFSNNIYCQTRAVRLRSARGLPWGYSKHVKLISKL